MHLEFADVPGDAEILSDPEVHDLSAFDGKKIQLKFHYFDAEYDYWFAFDKVRVSGVQEAVEIPLPVLTLAPPNLTITWTAFAAQYTVEHTADLKGAWTQVGGPTTQMSFTGPIPGEKTGFYRVVGQ
jgi:hypothetical protein